MDAVTRFQSEIWSLFAVALAFTLLRIFARVKSVGFKGLQGDDYLAVVAIFGMAGEVSIAHTGGSVYHSEKAKGLIPGQTPGVKPSPEALAGKEFGNKLHFSQWVVYSTTLWILKASLLVLYMRLTTGLAGAFSCRIKFGFLFVAVSWVAVLLTIFLSCRPFNNYFIPAIDQPDVCKPAVSRPIVWTCYTFNVLTDLYLISIPLPMLWQSSMRTWKKIGLGILFSAGAIIIVFATIRCVLITIDPINGAPVSGTWAVRESFVAVITTNFPMAFTLIRGMLGPAFKSLRTSTKTAHEQQQEAKNSAQLQTFGSSKKGEKPRGVGNPTATNMLFSESEERIVNGTPTPLADEESSNRWSGPTLQSASDPESRKRSMDPGR